jgi:hypothetical protein
VARRRGSTSATGQHALLEHAPQGVGAPGPRWVLAALDRSSSGHPGHSRE